MRIARLAGGAHCPRSLRAHPDPTPEVYAALWLGTLMVAAGELPDPPDDFVDEETIAG
jgi:hypothetical protein